MDKLKIINESLPERCEICHCSDLFNSETGYCARCNNVIPAIRYETQPKIYLKQNTQGIWRDGPTLVMHKNADLPDRCVKCNAPADGQRVRRKLSWHHPAYFFFLLLNVIIFIIVSSAVRKRATVQIGLCKEHHLKRRRDLKISWSTALIGFLIFFLGLAEYIPSGGIFIGLCLFSFGIIYGVLSTQIVKPSKIDDYYVWLKGINNDYLSQFPQLPH
jgi:hypothetical protein